MSGAADVAGTGAAIGWGYEHPAAGELTLRHEALAIVDAEDQVIHVDIAEPGSASELALRRIVSAARADAMPGDPHAPAGRAEDPQT